MRGIKNFYLIQLLRAFQEMIHATNSLSAGCDMPAEGQSLLLLFIQQLPRSVTNLTLALSAHRTQGRPCLPPYGSYWALAALPQFRPPSDPPQGLKAFCRPQEFQNICSGISSEYSSTNISVLSQETWLSPQEASSSLISPGGFFFFQGLLKVSEGEVKEGGSLRV